MRVLSLVAVVCGGGCAESDPALMPQPEVPGETLPVADVLVRGEAAPAAIAVSGNRLVWAATTSVEIEDRHHFFASIRMLDLSTAAVETVAEQQEQIYGMVALGEGQGGPIVSWGVVGEPGPETTGVRQRAVTGEDLAVTHTAIESALGTTLAPRELVHDGAELFLTTSRGVFAKGVAPDAVPQLIFEDVDALLPDYAIAVAADGVVVDIEDVDAERVIVEVPRAGGAPRTIHRGAYRPRYSMKTVGILDADRIGWFESPTPDDDQEAVDLVIASRRDGERLVTVQFPADEPVFATAFAGDQVYVITTGTLSEVDASTGAVRVLQETDFSEGFFSFDELAVDEDFIYLVTSGDSGDNPRSEIRRLSRR